MDLVPATEAHLRALMAWFPDQEGCLRWGGPDFRFPFTEATFREDCHWPEMPTYALVEAEDLLAFGQIYLRDGRCHLARLAVAPGHRRRGLGARLIHGLAEIGGRLFSTTKCSLFVMADNTPALTLYRKLGFSEAPEPDDGPDLDDCLFLTAETLQSPP